MIENYSSNSAVKLRGVTKLYNSNSIKTAGVVDVNLDVNSGELLLILGPSGSGKTTLLTLISGLIQPSSGEVFLFNRNLNEYHVKSLYELRSKQIGFVFQQFLLIEALTVIENIILVLQFAGDSKRKATEKAFELLSELNISHLAKKFPGKLSQGEKQRAALARAFANNADLILADEPTACLDTEQGIQIIKMLHRYAKENNKCVIIVSHDNRLKDFADRIIKIEDGRICDELVKSN